MEIEGKDLRVGTSSANLCLRQGVLALPWPCNVALREDALALLRPLSIGCTALVSSIRNIARCSTGLPTATRGRASASAAHCRQ